MFKIRKENESPEVSIDKESVVNIDNKEGKFSFILLVGLIFLVPVFFIPLPFVSFIFAKQMLVLLATSILVVFWILNRLKDGEFIFSRNLTLIFGALIPVFYFISSLFSGNLKTSLIGQGFELDTFVVILSAFVLMFLTVSVLKTKKRIYYLFSAFFISFFIVSLFQIARLFLGPEFLSFGFFTNPTFNLIGKWNELSIFYGLTSLLSLVSIEFIDKLKSVKIFGLITLFISLFFVALVNFSFVWIVIGIFSFILASFIISSNKFINDKAQKNKRKFPIFSFLVVILSVIILWGNYSGSGINIGAGLSNYFNVSSTEVRPSLLGTSGVIKESLQGKEILIGEGPNSFLAQWALHKPIVVNRTSFWNIDFSEGFSFLTSALVNVGVGGFLLWLGFLGTLIFIGFKSIFILPKNNLVPMSFLAVSYLWLFFLVYTPTNTIMSLTFIFTGVLISLLIQNGVIKTKKISFSHNQRIDFVIVLVLISLLLGLVVGGFVVSQNFIASIYSEKGIIETNIEDAEKNIIKAVNLFEDDSHYRLLSNINLIKLQKALSNKNVSKSEIENNLNNTIAFSSRSVEMNKNNYKNWYALGGVYEAIVGLGLEGDYYDRAINSYMQAIKLNPNNPLLLFTLGRLEYNAKDYTNAMKDLERAVILRSDYSDAKFYLGLSYYYLDRDNDAILQFRDLLILNPGDKEKAELISVIKNMERGVAPLRNAENN